MPCMPCYRTEFLDRVIGRHFAHRLNPVQSGRGAGSVMIGLGT
jgi:hypothetical protein